MARITYTGIISLDESLSYINRKSHFHCSYRQQTSVEDRLEKVCTYPLRHYTKAHSENTNLFKENIFHLNTTCKYVSAQRK